jgi:hypothetical protein
MEQSGNDMTNAPVNNILSAPPDNATPDNATPDNATPDNCRMEKQHGFIDTTGMCISCQDSDANDLALKCMFCTHNFHAVCKDISGDKSGNEILCSSTFFKAFDTVVNGSGVYRTRKGNFKFACDVCMTDFEKYKVATPANKVDDIDKRVDKLTQSMEEMKTLLNKVVTLSSSPQAPSNPPPVTPSPMSYAGAATKRSVLVATADGENNQANQAIINKIINEKSILIDYKHQNKKGETVIVLPSEKDRDTLSQSLADNKVTTRTPTERLPTISVAHLPKEFTKEDLRDVIFEKMPDIKSLTDNGETFTVLRVKEQRSRFQDNRNKKFQAFIRVSDNIRRLIEKQGNRIYIQDYSCPVFDHFHVKRCNYCQGFHHYAGDDCKASSPTCGYCAGRHESDNCTHKGKNGFIPCCFNCRNSQQNTRQHSHTAFDRSCDAYITEQNRLRKTINYYVPKNM